MPTDDSDIFGAMAPQKGAADDSDIFAAPKALAQRASMTAAPKPSPQAAAQGQRQTNPYTMGVGDMVRGGVQGLVHGIGAIANKIAPDSQIAKEFSAGIPEMDAQIRRQDQDYAAARTARGETGTDWKRVAGNIGGAALATANLPMAARSLVGAVGTGALSGAVGGALQPVTQGEFGAEKLRQVATGAGIGGALGPVTNAVGRMLAPSVSPEVRALQREGVTPTIGQIRGGMTGRNEQKLSSVPVLGDSIKAAQRRAMDDFNRAAYNRVLAPIGEKFDGRIGHEGIEQIQNKLSQAYDDVLSKATLQVDKQFQGDVMKLGQMAQGLPESEQKTFMNVLKSQIFDKLGPQGLMDGPTLKGVQSELGRAARGYMGDQSFDKQQLGRAIAALKDAVDDNLARVNPADVSSRLASVNQAFANFTRVQKAAASAGAMNKAGIFTPAQLNTAVRQLDTTVRKGATAKGQALMQDLASAGQQVLGSVYPDSGTAGRLGLLGAIAGGASLNPTATAAAVGGGLLGMIPYTQAGQRVAAGLLTQQNPYAQGVGSAIRQLGPRGAAALALSNDRF